MITLGGISTSTKKILIHALDFEFRLFLSFIRRNDPYFAESMIFVQIMLRKVKCGVGNAKRQVFGCVLCALLMMHLKFIPM